MLEHFSTNEDGEPHDPPHQGVESWKKSRNHHLLSYTESAGEEFRPSVLEFSPRRVEAFLRHLLRVQQTCDADPCGLSQYSTRPVAQHIKQAPVKIIVLIWKHGDPLGRPCVHLPSVMRARLVSTLPSMNLMMARMMHAKPLMMDTLNRNPS